MPRSLKTMKKKQQRHHHEDDEEENGNTNTTTATQATFSSSSLLLLSSCRLSQKSKKSRRHHAGLFVLLMAALTLYHGSTYTSSSSLPTLKLVGTTMGYNNNNNDDNNGSTRELSGERSSSLRTHQQPSHHQQQQHQQQLQHNNVTKTKKTRSYEPAEIETWLFAPGGPMNGRKFNFHHNTKIRKNMADGCQLYLNESVSPFYDKLQQFRKEIHNYATILDNFLSLNDDDAMSTPTADEAMSTTTATATQQRHLQHLPEPKLQPVKDLRKQIMADGGSHQICDTLELHPQGLQGIFGKSQMLSKVPHNGGFVEPLITPLRHLEHCYANHPYNSSYIMDMHYLIHDFASLCRKLTPTSRTVFIDMGASLDFHDDQKDDDQNTTTTNGTDHRRAKTATKLAPAVFVTEVYQKFGFKFDHIYAYEVTPKEPTDVYSRIPEELKSAYHWYNVGVNATITSSHNPLKLLLENFDENDFVVVKLDIDTHSIEQPMVELILNDERFHKLIDVFYFEHHVHLLELAPYWRTSMFGTVEDSLQLFSKLREKGVAAHYWP